jgi:polyferredoxin
MTTLTTFRFNPPAIDESLRQWLHKISFEELREHLKIQNRKEWVEFWIENRLYAIFYSIVFVIVFTILGTTNPKGIWETMLIGAAAGLIIAPFFAVTTVLSLLYDLQWKRWRWFKKQKLMLMKSVPQKNHPRSVQ